MSVNTDLETAKQQLATGKYTCVLCRGDAIVTSQLRGVKPLLSWLEQGSILPGFSAADKVVGQATAYLYCLLGAKAVYAGVMSRSALKVLSAYEMDVSYGSLVEHIRNRDNTGMCPMEQATHDCHTPEEALAAIRETLKRLAT